jgi:hypothetical protein
MVGRCRSYVRVDARVARGLSGVGYEACTLRDAALAKLVGSL